MEKYYSGVFIVMVPEIAFSATGNTVSKRFQDLTLKLLLKASKGIESID